jgi:hypothetical protein
MGPPGMSPPWPSTSGQREGDCVQVDDRRDDSGGFAERRGGGGGPVHGICGGQPRFTVPADDLLPCGAVRGLPVHNFIDELANAQFRKLGLFPRNFAPTTSSCAASTLDTIGGAAHRGGGSGISSAGGGDGARIGSTPEAYRTEERRSRVGPDRAVVGTAGVRRITGRTSGRTCCVRTRIAWGEERLRAGPVAARLVPVGTSLTTSSCGKSCLPKERIIGMARWWCIGTAASRRS